MTETFGFRQKWELCNHWVMVQPPLTRTGLRVLILLLQHCNPRTRQCNPSIRRLARMLDASERGVQMAIRELKECGAIENHAGGRGGSNQYAFLDPEDAPEGDPAPLNPASQKGEACFAPVASSAPPKKSNKNIKKRQTAPGMAASRKPKVDRRSFEEEPRTRAHEERFNDDIKRKLRHKGFIPDTVLMELPIHVYPQAYDGFCDGALNRTAAIDQVVAACVDLVRRGP